MPPTRVVAEFGFDPDARRLREYLCYESMANEVFAAYGSAVACLRDRRRHPRALLSEVCQTHPELLASTGRVPSGRYRQPADYLGSALATWPPRCRLPPTPR